MRIPGNMWVEVWQSARSVPVRRQKRLFDETKEAEKVLSNILYFPVSYNSLCLSPKFCINYCVELLLGFGNIQTSRLFMLNLGAVGKQS